MQRSDRPTSIDRRTVVVGVAAGALAADSSGHHPALAVGNSAEVELR